MAWLRSRRRTKRQRRVSPDASAYASRNPSTRVVGLLNTALAMRKFAGALSVSPKLPSGMGYPVLPTRFLKDLDGREQGREGVERLEEFVARTVALACVLGGLIDRVVFRIRLGIFQRIVV